LPLCFFGSETSGLYVFSSLPFRFFAQGSSRTDSELRARDAWAAGIEIMVLPMLKPGRAVFDADAFWTHIVATEEEETRQVPVKDGVVVEAAVAHLPSPAGVASAAGASEGAAILAGLLSAHRGPARERLRVRPQKSHKQKSHKLSDTCFLFARSYAV
jgi:hypothetical protein